MNKLTLCGFH